MSSSLQLPPAIPPSEPGGYHPPRWLAGALFALLTVIGIWLVPPLFDYDGYTNWLYGQAVLDNLNPSHLLWIPLQSVFWRVFGWLHWTGPRPFQIVGILLTAVACVGQFWLLAQRREDVVLALVMAVGLATAPQIWFVTPLNQPYPLLFLLEVALLWHWRDRFKPTGWSLLVLGLVVVAAALLHQAALLWAGVVVILIGSDSAGTVACRLRRAMAWGLGVGAVVGLGYAMAAWLQGIRSPLPMLHWAQGYVTGIHGVFQERFGNVIKGGFGMLGALVQTDRLAIWLNERNTANQLFFQLAAAEALLMALAIAVGCSRQGRAWLRCWLSQPLGRACLALLAAWSLFCIAWEPTNSKFWSVNLFPCSVLVMLVARALSRRVRCVGFLIAVAVLGWNLYENHAADQHNATRFPDPQLSQIHQQVQPRDRLVFMQRQWVDQVDYDLLTECLAWENFTNVTTLVERYLAAPTPNWETAARQEFDGVLRAGGKIFVSDLVFNLQTYQSLANDGLLAAYSIDVYRAIQGPDLYQRVQVFFAAYDRQPAELQLGADRFWLIRDWHQPRANISLTPAGEK